MQKVTPCLWFDTEGEEAARFYTSVFPNSRIVDIARYGSAGPRPEGTVMTVAFELDGQRFTALNGGPDFTFNESISFEVECGSQDEVDAFWTKLSEGGPAPGQPCKCRPRISPLVALEGPLGRVPGLTGGPTQPRRKGSMTNRSPIQLAALAVGAVFLLVGILGFIPGTPPTTAR
jgi:predicted 3-demethylubiquinone-9 3-methyltransferase (glyoxalase superfamily)